MDLLDSALDTIKDYTEDDWDGDRAIALSDFVIEIADGFLKRFSYRRELFVGASSYGEIDLCWGKSWFILTIAESGFYFNIRAGDTRIIDWGNHDPVDLLTKTIYQVFPLPETIPRAKFKSSSS